MPPPSDNAIVYRYDAGKANGYLPWPKHGRKLVRSWRLGLDGSWWFFGARFTGSSIGSLGDKVRP